MQEIKIVLVTEINEPFTNGFNVIQGDKIARGLGFDEMLGLIATLTMPKDKPHLKWMKTKEEIEAWENAYKMPIPDSIMPLATRRDETLPVTVKNYVLLQYKRAIEALKEISEGKGRYSEDKLTHASNTIEDMKEIATQTLKELQ